MTIAYENLVLKEVEISENYKLVVDFLFCHTLYCDSTIEIESNTLI